METLHWPLQVLTRAVRYQNLSQAAQNIGVSQPQLSRIVKQLEDELDLALLDRSARNKSRWTPLAFKVAALAKAHGDTLTQEFSQLAQGVIPETIRLGSLEGLIPVACKIGHSLLELPEIKAVHVEVLDLSELETEFVQGRLDAVVTCRQPGLKKYSQVRHLGIQEFEVFSNDRFDVYSSHEYEGLSRAKRKTLKKTLVSRSLEVRKHWLQNFGGRGKVPGPIRSSSTSHKALAEVLVLGSENMAATLWDVIANLKVK